MDARSSDDILAAVRAGSRLCWDDLPRWIVLSSALSLAGAAPVLMWTLIPAVGALLSPLPVMVATAVVGEVAHVADGGRPRLVGVWRRADVRTALTVATAAVAALLLAGAGGPLAAAGAFASACVLVLGPMVVGRVAVRDEGVVDRWRAAVLLVALRPASAATALALGVLTAFAVIASSGTLALVLPAWWLVVTATLVDRASRSLREALRT